MSLRIFIPILAVLLSLPLSGQKLDHVLGEIIVELPMDMNPESILEERSTFNGRSIEIKAYPVISYPKNIWRIVIDHKTVNEIDFMEDIKGSREVIAAQQNFILQYRRVPNDPRFDEQWQFINDGSNGGVDDVDTDAEIAWDITTGGLTAEGDTIILCVIDDGADLEHEEFSGNLWVNHSEIPNNNIDDDNNGFIDDYRGWDSTREDDDVTREGSHGTSVMGIVGAKGNNGIGVTGVNWDVKMMIVRGGTSFSNAIQALSYPYTARKKYNDTNGAEGSFVVGINCSWGFDRRFAEEAPIWCDFYDQLGEVGIVTVASTANLGINVEEEGDLPTTCTSPFLIGVTNMQRSGELRSSAAIGETSIDISAPGENVFTTRKGGDYRSFAGTSGASPHVTGTIGLMYATPCGSLTAMSKNSPSMAAIMVREILLGTSDYYQSLGGKLLSDGMLNIGNAVTSAQALCDACAYPSIISYSSSIDGASFNAEVIPDNNIDIRYRRVGNSDWTEESGLSFPVMVTGLTGCNKYEIQFKTACATESAYSPSTFFVTDNCCTLPSDVTITEGENALVFSWDEVTAAEHYFVEFREVGTEFWNLEVVFDNSFTLDQILTCKGYEFRIKTKCDASTETDYSFPMSLSTNCQECLSTDYCVIEALDNDFEWIDLVTVGNTTITTGKNFTGYAYLLGADEINLSRGITYPVNIDLGFRADVFEENLTVFIDWQGDGSFDSEDIAFDPESGSSFSGDITVPMNADLGYTRMRIVMSFNDTDDPCDAIGLEFGEVEDYCVLIGAAGDCSETIQVETTDVSGTSISLFWTAIDGVDDYTIRYRLKGASEWIEQSSSTQEALISGLSKCETYETQVKANCSGQNTDFSPIQEIPTRCSSSIQGNERINLSISPNPFTDRINIEWDAGKLDDDENITSISLVTLDGRLLINKSVGIESSSETIDLHDDQLAPGLYLVYLRSQKTKYVEKLIKL